MIRLSIRTDIESVLVKKNYRSDVKLFCKATVGLAADHNSAEEAERLLRSRLENAASEEKELLYFALAKIFRIKGERLNFFRALDAARSVLSGPPGGRYYLRRARLLQNVVPNDTVECYFRQALDLTTDKASLDYCKLLLGIHLFFQARTCQHSSVANLARDALDFVENTGGALSDVEEAQELAISLEWAANNGFFNPADNRICLDAIRTCEHIESATEHEEACLNLSIGIFSELAGNNEKAQNAYGKALSAPGRIAIEKLVLRLARLCPPGKATRRIEAALRNAKCSNPYELYVELCRLYDENGHDATALRLVKQCRLDSRVPGSCSLQQARARFFLLSGNERRAVECLSPPDSTAATALLARLLKRAGRNEEALALLANLEVDITLPLEERLDIARSLDNASLYGKAYEWYRSIRNEGVIRHLERDVVSTAVGRYKDIEKQLGLQVPDDETLAVAEAISRVDTRKARAYLRRAATSDSAPIRRRALLALGALQLKNDPQVARTTLQEAMATPTRHRQGETHYLMALACLGTGKDDEAAWHLNKAVKSSELLSVVAAYMELAKHWLRTREPVRALACLDRALDFPPVEESIFLPSLRANALEMAGDTTAASELYQVLSHSKNRKIRFHSLVCLAGIAANSDFDKSSRLLDEAVEKVDPLLKRLAGLLKGRYALLAGRYERAVAEFDTVLWPTWPEYGTCLSLRSQALLAMKRIEQARRNFRLALIECSVPSVWPPTGEPAGLAPLFLPEFLDIRKSRERQIEKIREELKRIEAPVHRKPNPPQESRTTEKGVAAVKRILKSLLDEDGAAPELLYHSMSRTFFMMGRKKAGRLCSVRSEISRELSLRYDLEKTNIDRQERDRIQIEEEILPSGAKLFRIFPASGQETLRTKKKQDDPEHNIVRLENALKRTSPAGRGRKLFNLANALFDARKFDEAEIRYMEALLDPSCPQRNDVRHNLGIVRNELKQFNAAIECFDTVINEGAEDLRASAWYHKGNALVELDRSDEALQCYEKVLTDPYASSDLILYSLINIAHCKEFTGQGFEAKRCLLEALGHSRRPGWIMLRLATLGANQGDLREARSWKERARDEFLKYNDIFGLRKLQELLKGI